MSPLKTALVLGGTGGIGAAIVRRLCADRMKVYATFAKDSTKAKALEASFKNCTMIRCDLTSVSDIEKMLDRVLGESSVDVFINSSATNLKLKMFEALTIDEITEDLDVFFLGVARVLHRLLPGMKAQRSGIIVLVLSSVIAEASSRMSSYASAKHALWGLGQCLAAELKAYGVNVVGISPSFVETDLLQAFPSKLLEMEKNKRGGDFLSPQDIADFVFAVLRDPTRLETGTHVLLQSKDDVKRLTS